MTNEERGAYISLLCLQWSKGFVTELDIQRICLGMPTHSHGICQSKFQVESDGNYKNIRLEVERFKQKERSEKQRDIANLRWNKDANALPTHSQEDAKADARSVPEVCFPSPSPTPNNKEKSIAPKSQRSHFTIPSVEEVESECVKIELPVLEAQKFVNYYESKGWVVGKSKMKSWKNALIGWKNRQIEFQQQRERQQALLLSSNSKTVLSTNFADYQ